MAETKELRHAGIGIDLKVNGLDDFKRANSMMDDLLETMKEASRITDKFKSNFSGFGGKSSDEVRKTRDAVQDVYHSMGSTKNATNKVTENVHKMQQEFKHTSDAAKKIKLNSGLNSDINKSDEEVKKLAKSADQSGNKFNEMFRKLRSGSSKSNGSFSKLHDSAKKTFDEVHKGTHFLRDVVTASFISNAAINTWYSLKSGIGSALKAGEEYDKEQQVMRATWNTLTDSSVKGNRMVKAINSMSVSFGQSAGLVNELNQQFYHVLDKQGPTDRLTKSVLTMADTLGMGAENTKRLGLNFTHMMASSKMQLGDFNMISDQLPMFGSKLLAYERKAMHNSHLTMSQLRKDMSAGKVSAKDAENVMNSLGKKYAEASENMMKTLPGMERVMSARGAALFGALEKPFMKAKNPIFGAISKWVSDKKTEKEFTKVGTAASKGLNTITQSFAKVFNPKESPHLANDVMNNIAKGVTSVSNTIAHHAKSIVEFFKSLYYTVKMLKDVGAGFAKGLVSGLSAIVTPIGKLAGNSKKIHSFSDALKSITNRKKGLEDIGKLLAGIWGTSKAIKGISFAKNMVGKTTRMFIKPEIDSKTGKHELTLFSKAIRSTTKGIGKSLRWTAKLAYKGVVKGLSVIKTAAIATGKGFKLAFNFLKANPFIAIITGAIAVGAVLYKLYKHNKKFRKFVNGLISWAKKAWKGITKWFGKLAKDVSKYISNLVKNVNKRWGWLFKDLWKITKGAFKTIFDILKTFYHLFTGKWRSLGKDVVKIGKDLWKDVKHLFKTGFDWVNKLTGGKLEDTIKLFSNAWHSIGKGWKSFWNGISDWFGNLWKGIVKHVQDGINNVIKVLNSGISGIDSVIHAFGGSSKAIGTINPVRLATGTGALSGQRRAITRPTMAMLNDGHDSPETGNREMLIHPNGMGELIKGTNVMRMLEPGAEVLNATEAKMAMSMQHFASGTGFFSNLWKGTKKVAADAVGGVESGISGIGSFASKAWHGATHLLSTIQKIIAGPGKYLNSLMGKKPSGQGAILSDFAGGFYNSMKKQASTWWSSLWSMASGVLDNSGTGGSWRHDPGLTKTNGFGASRSFGSHDGVDFSGSLGSPILAVHGGKVTHTGRPLHGWPYSQLGDVITVASDDGYQEIYQEFGGMNNIKTSTGDIIKTGQKIATLGRLNGAGSGSHVHIGVSHGSLWDHGGSNTSGWYDVTKMHGKDNGSSKLSHSHTGGAMHKLIQQETGGMMGWIKKHLSPLMDDGGGSMGNPGGAGVQRWRSYVKKALSALNLSTSGSMVDRILRQINTESSGNPKAMGGTDGLSDGHAEGLMQVKPGTFAANKLSGHGNIWNGYDNILAGLNYAKHRYGSGLSFLGNGHGYAKGGKIPKGQLSVVGEKGWELFQPNTSGTVIPHEASERLINGRGKGKVSISAPTKVVIQGNADKSAIDELDSRLEKRNDDLVEKFRELWGLNDEGGLTV